jgi:hypothetical protein
MSNEKYVEELLFKASKKNNRSTILELSKKMRDNDPKLSVYESIERAYNEINNVDKKNG